MFTLPVIAYAQVAEDFSDGDFTGNPEWTGDTAQFEVNTSLQLHLKTTGADTSAISTANTRISETEWHFWVKLSFNTSANNFARVYLASDNADLKGSLNGYFLQIGGSNDSIGFFRQTGSASQQLFRFTKTTTGNSLNVIRVKVIHDASNKWYFSCDATGGINYSDEGSVPEDQITATNWLGIYCRFTASNSTKFYFDDFYSGPVIVDTEPPQLSSVSTSGDRSLVVKFSEIIDKSSCETITNYQTRSCGSPVSAMRDTIEASRVMLTFGTAFPDGVTDTLTATGIKDIAGNTAQLLWAPFSRYNAKPFDIVISEIMADPSPPYGLPEAEYAELFNRTKYPLNLKNWIFEYGSSQKILPEVTINPHGYLILSKGTLFNTFGPGIDLFTSSSTLANEGSILILKNADGKIIHSVSYSSDWYNDPDKAEGGWSLEMIDPGNPCGCADNWAVSTEEYGGSPGFINSVSGANPDTIPPHVKRAIIEDLRTIKILFSEPMDSLSFLGSSDWMITNGIGNPAKVNLISPDFSSLRLALAESIERGIIYQISPGTGIRDCSGNLLDVSGQIRIAIPDTISPGDIVINEILPDPASGGERFIELFNRSEKILDLKGGVLSSYDSVANELKDPCSVSGEGFLLFPGEYAVLTKDPGDIRKRYVSGNPDCFISLSSFPSYNDNEGTVVISKKADGTIIDLVSYSGDMQFPLLTTTEGVSLERVSAHGSSQELKNWHSAASSCGYATPGYKNSQDVDFQPSEAWITILPGIFTPDNDGKDDLLTIHVHPDSPGYMGSLVVYNRDGRFVRRLVNNSLFGDSETFFWDGVDDTRVKAPVGIYILFLEAIKPDGTVKREKKAVVVGVRF